MKEQFRNEPAPIQSGLTIQTPQNRLRGGDIFMPDRPGDGEINIPRHKGQTEARQVSPGMSELVKKAWDVYNRRREERGEAISFNERSSQEIMARQGLGPPIEGGADPREKETLYDRIILDVEEGTRTNNPDLIEKAVRDIPMGIYLIPEGFFPALAGISCSNEAIRNNLYGFALEYALETVLSKGDRTPDLHLQITPNESHNITNIVTAARNKDITKNKAFAIYLQELAEKRQVAHEVFLSMKHSREIFTKYVTEHLKTGGFNFLENEIVGIPLTQVLWEKVLGDKVSKKTEWLEEKDFIEANDEVEELLREYSGRRVQRIYEFELEAGGKIAVERALRFWEIDRAIAVGRAVAGASQRRVSYNILGEVPENSDDRFKSMDSEYIARVLAGRKVLAQRFGAKGFSGAKAYMRRWVDNTREIAGEKGLRYTYVDKDGKKRSIYGKKEDSWILMDTGVPDVKSHGWRSRLMFLKGKEYGKVRTPEGTILTMGDYLDQEWEKVKNLKKGDLERELGRLRLELTKEDMRYLEDRSTGRVKKEDRIRNLIFSHNVEEVVKGQRLYLGTLLREEHFTPQLRAYIWEKTARLLPSRIFAFFRKDIIEEKIVTEAGWDALRKKLYKAEMARVETDALKVKIGNFKAIAMEDLSEDILGKYLDAFGITASEAETVKKVIAFGKSKAGQLSKIIFPQNPFLDDVPKSDWKNLSQNDIERLLVGDDNAYNGAINDEIGAVATSPDMPSKEVVQHYVKAKDHFKGPIGPNGAQDRLEADILSYYQMATMKTAAKWGAYFFDRLLRRPTSEIEKHNLSSYISKNEEEISKELDLLAQHGVISSSRERISAEGRVFHQTQLQEMKKKLKADIWHIWGMWLRMLIMFLPPTMGIELGKVLIPRDALKAA